MRDPETFTVDDPRFSTGAVLGPNMLSLDGAEHRRHRDPFAPYFRPGAVRGPWVSEEARRLVAALAPAGEAELREAMAAPLAVATIVRFLGLVGVGTDELLGWYRELAQAVVEHTPGGRPGGGEAMGRLTERVEATVDVGSESMLAAVAADGRLARHEIAPNAAVAMFGAIETSEGMTANALWHLLTKEEAMTAVVADRGLIGAAVEESLRLEPAAAVIDRYATRAVTLGGLDIEEGALVQVSLRAANRDPEVFDEPDEFMLGRPDVGLHVAFVQGPHACLGAHLARLETVAAIEAVLDLLGPQLRLVPERSRGPEGEIFRKATAVVARW